MKPSQGMLVHTQKSNVYTWGRWGFLTKCGGRFRHTRSRNPLSVWTIISRGGQWPLLYETPHGMICLCRNVINLQIVFCERLPVWDKMCFSREDRLGSCLEQWTHKKTANPGLALSWRVFWRDGLQFSCSVVFFSTSRSCFRRCFCNCKAVMLALSGKRFLAFPCL